MGDSRNVMVRRAFSIMHSLKVVLLYMPRAQIFTHLPISTMVSSICGSSSVTDLGCAKVFMMRT